MHITWYNSTQTFHIAQYSKHQCKICEVNTNEDGSWYHQTHLERPDVTIYSSLKLCLTIFLKNSYKGGELMTQ